MPTPPLDYALLAVFVAVAEENSFSKASVRLGLGKGTVSRRIAELEAKLGAELLHRTTHAVALSTVGAALYERVAPHLRALDEGVGQMHEQGERPSGVLRLTAPPDISSIVLPAVFARFALRHPEVVFELHITNAIVDLVAQGFDLAIRAVALGMKQSALTVRRIAAVNGGFYAAPSYLARRGQPRAVTPDHDWIIQPSVAQRWKLPRPQMRFLCDDFTVMRELASEGAGVAFLPNYFATPYVRTGALKQIVIPGRSLTVPLVLLYPSRGQVPRKVIAFRDFLIEWLDKAPLS